MDGVIAGAKHVQAAQAHAERARELTELKTHGSLRAWISQLDNALESCDRARDEFLAALVDIKASGEYETQAGIRSETWVRALMSELAGAVTQIRDLSRNLKRELAEKGDGNDGT